MLKIKKCSKGISECVMRGYWVTLCALIAAYPLPVFSATIDQLVARQRAVMERELDAKLRKTDASAFSVQPLPGTAASPARGAHERAGFAPARDLWRRRAGDGRCIGRQWPLFSVNEGASHRRVVARLNCTGIGDVQACERPQENRVSVNARTGRCRGVPGKRNPPFSFAQWGQLLSDDARACGTWAQVGSRKDERI